MLTKDKQFIKDFFKINVKLYETKSVPFKKFDQEIFYVFKILA